MEQWGQETSEYHLYQEARQLHRFLCIDPARRELISQKVLTQAYMPTGGTSSNRRQKDQLTPEKIRWQKASTGMIPKEAQATWKHENPSLPPQQVLATPTHGKSKSLDLKSNLLMIIEDFKKYINNSIKEID